MGCGQPGGVAPPSARDATLTIGLTSGRVDVRPIVHALTTQRLIGTAPDGRPTPGIIESWTLSPDGRTWDFHVRPDVRRHDGAAVTADDVVALIRDQMSYDPPAGLIDVEQVRALDERRLQIQLRAPSSMLLEALTLTRAVPAGAFVATEPALEADSTPTLRASESAKASATASAIGQVDLKRYDSPRSAWAALMRDEIDMLYEVSGEARPFLEQAPGIEVRPFLRPFVLTLGLNARHPVLGRTDVRRALNHAVDRDELLEQDLGGQGVAAAGPVWPRHWAADPSVKPYAFDSSRARRLLDAAGLPVRERPDGRPSRIRITCLLPDDMPPLERVALRVRRAFAAVGVDLVLEPVSRLTLATRLGEGSFEAFLVPVMSGYGHNALYHMWGRHSPNRYVDYGYTSVEDEVERLRRAHTDEGVSAALRAVQQVLIEDPPAVFLVWEEAARAVGRRFVVPPSPGRDILSTIPLWRPVPLDGALAP